MIDKQALLHVGDVILEVNGIEVCTPEDLQTEIARAKDSVTLKVGQVDLTANTLTHAPLMTNGHSAKNGVTKRLTVSDQRFVISGSISLQCCFGKQIDPEFTRYI